MYRSAAFTGIHECCNVRDAMFQLEGSGDTVQSVQPVHVRMVRVLVKFDEAWGDD